VITAICVDHKDVSKDKISKEPKSYNIRSNKSDVNDHISDNETSGADRRDYKYLEGNIHRDDEDLQKYITDRVYIDKRSGNILGERSLLLKDGKRHRARDPSPIHVQSLVEMTKKYDEESSSRKLRTLAANLLESGN